MNKNLMEKIKDSVLSVLPITIIILLLHFTVTPLPEGGIILFLISSVLLILGMGLFTLGAEISMIPLGENIGSYLTQTRKVWFIVLVCFIIGVIATIAEPDVQALAGQVAVLPSNFFVACVGIGSGIFLIIALLRIFLNIKLSHLLFVLFGLIFIIAIFTTEEYLALSFDASGVSTGAISVPLILALGVGISAVRGKNSSRDDSFGLFTICSLGPVFIILLMSIIFKFDTTGYDISTLHTFNNIREILNLYIQGFINFSGEVFLLILPIILFFIIFQIFFLKLAKNKVIKIIVGLTYTFLGVILFFVSVNVGFMPVGNYIGNKLGELEFNLIILPISIIIGLVIAVAEPAVHVLNKQVEEITGGAISKRTMLIAISIGVSASLFIAMIRILFDINIWWILLPGYVIALLLSFFIPNIFTAIAFDSGGIASGTMAATFLLPFALGVCESVGSNPITNAFGIIAIIALIPVIVIQLIGLIYNLKIKNEEKEIEEVLKNIEQNDKVEGSE